MNNDSSSKLAFPKAAPYIVITELAERFSFYGMKAILATFLVSQFFNPDNNPALTVGAEAKSNEVTHLFNALAYACSIIGGFLADRVLGRYKTIVLLSIVYCIGHLFLALFDTNYNLFFTGLMLVCLGAGGVKPNVSAMIGEQFDNPDDKRIAKLYDIFYFGINLGAFFSMLITPLLKKHVSASVAFGVPGVLMFIALLVFLSGTKKYKIVEPKRDEGVPFLLQMKQTWRVMLVFVFYIVYWALMDQNSSEWVLQAQKMDLTFMGVTWLSEQIQVANAVLILLFIPIFSVVIYPGLERIGIRVNALRKIGWGMILLGLAFLVSAWIQQQIDAGVQVNIKWQLFAYAVLTASEIMVSITGLEYAFTQAPKNLKSSVMAMFFLTVFFGNIMVSLINNNIHNGGFFSYYTGASYFLLFAGMMLVNVILYYAAVWYLNKTKPAEY
jgi:POT family proton-dependent oligopeptide transporter